MPKRRRRPQKGDTLIDRFWARVWKTETCWIWTGGKMNGYPVIGVNEDGKRKNKYAARLSWEMDNKRHVPRGKKVYPKKCDNRLCVRPLHLAAGTQTEINEHMRKFGHNQGTKNPHAKLTEADVQAIRTSTLSNQELAKKYGISDSRVRGVKRGEGWWHVKPP